MTTQGTAPLATTASNANERFTGCVKWFNNKAGYGFITVNSGFIVGNSTIVEGMDIFVHHSSIQVKNQQYKYLVQGEYVEFSAVPTNGGEHAVQTAEVTGIKMGKLMCETRHDLKLTRSQYQTTPEDFEEIEPVVHMPRSKQISSKVGETFSSTKPAYKARGEGPREGVEWTQVKRGTKKPASQTTEVKM